MINVVARLQDKVVEREFNNEFAVAAWELAMTEIYHHNVEFSEREYVNVY